jgi:serine/threonine-protein kinase
MGDEHTFFYKPGSESSRASTLGLPPELLEKSRRRVRLIAILVLIGFGTDVAIFLVMAALTLINREPTPHPGDATRGIVASLLGVLLPGGLIAATRSSRISNATILRLGLAFEVAICAIVSLVNPWAKYVETGHIPSLTWASPLIIMFPLIVPSRPRVALLTSILAAATAPLGLLFLHLTGRVAAVPEDFMTNLISPGVAVVFAYMASRTVYDLGINVEKARRMGSYRLEERLGGGGMGEVWRARHRMLARPAAVKLIRPELLGEDDRRRPEALARFEQEAQATAALRSPHTVELYDFGISNEGIFYYVMELLDGFDVETLVREYGPVSPERAVHLLRQVCESLAEAHDQGLIHRDIKPANVFVCRYGRRVDFVKVLDFGLVKHGEGSKRQDPKLTAQDVATGTPAYMSPEQVLGRPVDARSDIYGVGCLAYWLLSGELVFEGSHPMEILTQHAHSEPPPLSRRTEIGVPEELERIILSCLEKSPERRPQGADELAARLAAIEVGKPWSRDRAQSWWEAHRPPAPSS